MVETKDAKTTTISDQQQVNGRVMGLQHEGTVTPEPEPDVDDIVGSGDDDRDGGDKKAKAVGR